MSNPPLPPTFKSLYRLFLRASSATVLHHFRARAHLRRLWKPTFKEAATVIRQLQGDSLSSTDRACLTKWLRTWDNRMDNTLSMFLVSAKSRGLAHQLTQNLAFLFRAHRAWSGGLYYGIQRYWDPKLPRDSPQYCPPPHSHRSKSTSARTEMDVNAWGALGEIVQLAEGRDGLSLGKMTYPHKRR